jgi:hypothetical protein
MWVIGTKKQVGDNKMAPHRSNLGAGLLKLRLGFSLGLVNRFLIWSSADPKWILNSFLWLDRS